MVPKDSLAGWQGARRAHENDCARPTPLPKIAGLRLAPDGRLRNNFLFGHFYVTQPIHDRREPPHAGAQSRYNNEDDRHVLFGKSAPPIKADGLLEADCTRPVRMPGSQRWLPH